MERHRWLAYGAALALPAMALLLRSTLDASAGGQPLLILFIIPIALSAFVGGLGPGILASAVSVLLAEYYLLPPLYTLLRFSSSSVDLSLFLLIVGVFISGLIETLRRQRLGLQHACKSAKARADDRRASDERFSIVFHSAPVAIMIVRLSDGRLADVNGAFVELWGYTRQEALGCTSAQLRLWLEPAQFIRELKEERHRDVQALQIRHKSGEARDVLASVKMIQFDGAGHLLITAADLTERNRARQMEHIAHHDMLTDLPNRLLLQARLREALTRTAAGGGPSAVFFIDLDHFKEVNDALGHAAGDELLRLVAARLQGRIRATDTLARVGGDEFIALLEGLADTREAQTIAADLVQQMSAPFALSHGREVRISASVGISYMTAQVSDVELFVRQADAALYTAKNAGRNTVRVFQNAASGMI